jgi:hypothetical protein
MIAALCVFVLLTLPAGAADTQKEIDALAAQLIALPAYCPSEAVAPAPDLTVMLRPVGQTAWALSLAGRHDNARRLAEFALKASGSAKAAKRPPGSLPAEVRLDGAPSTPRCFVDAHAVSAALEAAWRYAAGIEPKTGAAWLAQWWPQINACAEFIVNWSRGPRGEPYPAYEPACGRDAGGPFESPGALLGVMCAQNLAQLAGRSVPETWQQRRDALEILVRTTDFTDALRATRTPWGLAQLRGILPEEHPLWLAPTLAGEATRTARETAWDVPSDPAQQIIVRKAPRPGAQAAPPTGK